MPSKINDPIGRGFFLPEHVTELINHAYEKTLVTKPVLEDDEMVDIDRLMRASMTEDFSVTVRYWVERRPGLGEIHQMWGVVQRIDPVRKQAKVVNTADIMWINLRDITAVIG
ncbi:YolD-like family protein [Brevibacillus sp. MER 51]|uniref:YolD-like family protein n=1 Tax=Brevibacillus sp. MER 51 TaxID=2939560 RepID=UPI00203EC5C1|nr:YolD-like family protein [Brevibacillus sp. MER 51]MCM3141281.1 YolD-like family protein [Brevibacillus sp. MER 51]